MPAGLNNTNDKFSEFMHLHWAVMNIVETGKHLASYSGNIFLLLLKIKCW